MPVAWRPLDAIADPRAPEAGPVAYHLYAVEARTGGEPVALGDEHSRPRWFGARDAAALPDLSPGAYRRVLAGVSRPRRQ